MRHTKTDEETSARAALRKVATPAAQHELLLALVCDRLDLRGEAIEACGRGLMRLPEKPVSGEARA